MKFLKQIKAFTLIELIISIVISSILFFIIFSFIVDSLDEIQYSNSRTALIDQIFSFRDKLNRSIKGGYINMSEIGNGTYNTLLLKDIYGEKGILFGVVNKSTLKLQKNYFYGENVIGYRLLSNTEITNIELDNNEIYNLNFFNDKLYNSLLVKDFDIDFYNSGAILDLNFSVLYFLNNSYIGESFSGIVLKNEDYVKFNLNF